MKIAIVNLSTYQDILLILENLEILKKNIVDPQIDLFIDDEVSLQLKEHKSIKNIYPLKLKNSSIFDLNVKYDNIKYYARNKYDIAIDMEGTKTSALTTYLLAGKTSGFKNKPLSLLYDEKIAYSDTMNTAQNINNLFIKTFGFENND